MNGEPALQFVDADGHVLEHPSEMLGHAIASLAAGEQRSIAGSDARILYGIH